MADGNKANFLGVPLTGWAVFAISLLAVGYAAGHVYITLSTELTEAKAEKIKLQNTNNKVTAEKSQLANVNADTSQYTDAVTKEMEAHKTDGSGHKIVLHHDGHGDVLATYFDSDGCIAIARPGGATLPYLPGPQATLEWSLGPGKKPPASPPPPDLLGTAPTTASFSGGNGSQSEVQRPVPPTKHTAEFRLTGLEDGPAQMRPVQASCLNPHPWAFQTWWGKAVGCWVPQYRRWNDGCTHYQMYNSCTGQWDPQIHWTFCAAQHHP
jgi:hypothetical protein